MTVTLGADITALRRAMAGATDLVASSARRMRRLTSAGLAGLGKGGALAMQKGFAATGFALKAGIGGALAGGVATVAGGVKAINAAADFEQTQVAFTTLIGDAAKAEATLTRLRKLGAETPFEFPELADAGRKLIRSNLADTARDFHAAVLSNGRAIPADAMEGQTFSGRQAERSNLADIVPDRAEAMRRLRVYHATVDTRARAMSTALEDQLAEARSQVETLQTEHQAQSELLTESAAAQEQLRGEVEALSAQLESLTTERDDARSQITGLNARVTELQESQTNFDGRLQAEVARVVASTGTNAPAHVTPAGDRSAVAPDATLQDLVAQYDQLVTDRKPEEAAAFFDQHLAKHFNR
ncbi:hypothetical protein N9Y81_02595 [Akkermansiaceae bacterium]|nr:hypothetical protein [Akkermansiaceae bacterium]